jgi:DNA-binding transcriptional regulator PaaX
MSRKQRQEPKGWLLLTYRVPSEPSRNRVSVWRELKRLGALFLQNCVCIVPDLPDCRAGLDAAEEKIAAAGGTHFRLPVPRLDAEQTERLVAAFRALSATEYQEIVEECETKFLPEIAFERGRGNFIYEEAEEIREDYEKIQRWFDRVLARDWFHADGREAVRRHLADCEAQLEAFEEEVYRRAGTDPAAHQAC